MLMISDDIGLARAVGAHGLHLPEQRTAAFEAHLMRRRWSGLLTCAAHDARALQRAARLGADAALLSPVFATASHPNGHALGLLRFLSLCRSAALPVYALGGMDRTNVARLRERNVVGIAGISGFI
jgi:thiamine-phosphate pyrophosphorylase